MARPWGHRCLVGCFRCWPKARRKPLSSSLLRGPAYLLRGWLPFRATLRRFTRMNGFLPLGVPFGTPKGTEKGPATSDSARLAAHNERRHPAKRARSCASKPHRGFDCFATVQQPGLRALGSLRERVGKAAASRALKNLTKVGLAAARRRFLCKGMRSR